MVVSECDTCIDNLLDDIEGQDDEMSGVQESLQTVSIGLAAQRRLESVNTTIIDFGVKSLIITMKQHVYTVKFGYKVFSI